MERLPDLLVLDFCEWLKQSLLCRTKYNDVDMWDLLFDDRYADILIKKAEEYCQRQKKQSEDWSNTGVRDMLSSLKERGIAVGIATRNCRDAVLESFPDIQSFCDTLVTRESTRRVKPDPEQILIALRALHVDASLSAMVGDHPMDIEAGRRAGSFTVGVLTGYSSADALTAAGANLIIERATHITRYLRTKKKG